MPLSRDGVFVRLDQARRLRDTLGLSQDSSYRLCFGEADRLPGLIVDAYLLESGSWVLVAQAQSAGAERMVDWVGEWGQRTLGQGTVVVARNDASIRQLDGLEVQQTRLVSGRSSDKALRAARVRLSGATFEADLWDGQKTGLFLDQADNIQRVCELVRGRGRVGALPETVRILDLFCYVGHWGRRLAEACLESGAKRVEVVLADRSEGALSLAEKNLKALGPRVSVSLVKQDLVQAFPQNAAESSFDLVVCDPPAMIQGRKHVPQGTHAYLQLFTESLKRVRSSGIIVCCSCSALFEEAKFIETLAKAGRRAGRDVSWIERGGQAQDHPVLASFPEGRYLKAWVGYAVTSAATPPPPSET